MPPHGYERPTRPGSSQPRADFGMRRSPAPDGATPTGRGLNGGAP